MVTDAGGPKVIARDEVSGFVGANDAEFVEWTAQLLRNAALRLHKRSDCQSKSVVSTSNGAAENEQHRPHAPRYQAINSKNSILAVRRTTLFRRVVRV
jgi:hypothetical protein